MIWRKKQAGRKSCRIAGVLLAVSLVLGLTGIMTPEIQAASWMDYYLEKVVDWGVMRGDINGNLEPDRPITRAEFVCMVNRAYGYEEVLPTPFTDIAPEDWFYEDICIAYNAGYFAGDSETTASPNGLLTREQAAVLICNNMMLEQESGEALGFSDSRDFASWSRHRIQAIAKEGVLSGYPDGSFKPQEPITRGQVAVMLVKAVGTPVQKSGEVSLGGVYGNVTITEPGVKLKDTTIYGDLYVTGGVGLSNVMLENVNVKGKIVVSGSGESEKGEHSVVLRNVQAEELVMDSMNDKFITLKADGLTSIETTNVRTGCYLEDVTNDGIGLKQINLDGESGTRFQLAGNIKNVLNLTQASTVTLAQGIAKEVTIDEEAAGATLHLNKDTVVEKVNLDAASAVAGTGDIGHMNVNVAGCTSSILPDTITVRPGITANINGEVMDSIAAQESSEDPRILSGYPKARNVTSSNADVYFKTNKKGTVYWALTALADGTVGEDELLSPGEYSGIILKSGTAVTKESNTEFTAKMTGLTKDGSYYVSAMLVDNRGLRSPVKITAFTTPDDTIPAFASGYPQNSVVDTDDDEQIIQTLVMPNKNCKMYYTLLPKGSVAPTAADFKANAVTGNLGYGVVELTKNTPYLVPKVNSTYLEEQTDYELYLWLTDSDGRLSSAVKKMVVTTLDRTPPKIEHLSLVDVTGNSVTLSYMLNEPGTLYWAVVREGARFYVDDAINGNEILMQSEEAMAQIESGINSLNKGSSNAGKASTEVKFTINKLDPQTAYDVYYVAKDKAGNYGIYDMEAIDLPYTVYTLDNEGPTVKQEFTHSGSEEGEPPMPYPDTSIHLVFSENIQGVLDLDQDGNPDNYEFLIEYQKSRNNPELEKRFVEVLSAHIKLYEDGETAPVPARTEDDQTDWVIDYRKARLQLDPSGTGNLILTLPYNSVPADSALNLSGGKTYQFRLEGIADTSVAANRMQGVRGITRLEEFSVISAQIVLSKTYSDAPKPEEGEAQKYFDMTFKARPVSHEAMADEILWDMIVWSGSSISFKLYESKDNGESWTEVAKGNTEAKILTPNGELYGVSIGSQLRGEEFQPINELEERLYSIEITSLGGVNERVNFNVPVTVYVSMVTGNKGALRELGNKLTNSALYDTVIGESAGVSDITVPIKPMSFALTRTFMDNTAPKFEVNYPKFTVGDSTVEIEVALDRPNSKFYYAVAPLGDMVTKIQGNDERPDFVVDDATYQNNWILLPQDGEDIETLGEKHLAMAITPTSDGLVKDIADAGNVGSIKYGQGAFNRTVVSKLEKDLEPNTQYIAYFVLQGESQESLSPQVYCYRFKTGDVKTPVIILLDDSPSVGVETTTDAELEWFLISSSMVSQTTLDTPFYQYIGLNHTDGEITEANRTEKYEEKMEEFHSNFVKYFPELGSVPDDPAEAKKLYQQVRVIDAIAANISGPDSMSVFDRYISEESGYYDVVLRAITETTGTGYIADRNELSTKQDTYYTVSPGGMSGRTQYYFVAAARNKLGSQYSFKALANVHLQDEDPPTVSVYTYLTSVGEKTNTGEIVEILPTDDKYLDAKYDSPGKYYHSGTVTLSFSEVPYRYYHENQNDNIYKREPLDITTIKSHISSSGNNIESIELSESTITIAFKHATSDSFLLFFSDGWIGDMYGAMHEEKLKLTFDAPIVNLAQNKEPPKFTPEEWPAKKK